MSTKPISTCVSDALLFIVRLFLFVLLGNPLSMFILNLFAPRSTAEFAKNQNLFGKKIYAFYEYWALKWPFYWAKWWMKLEDIRKYPVKKQIKYFLKVSFKNNTAVETLKKMMSFEGMNFNDACEKLFFEYGDKKLPISELRSRKVGQCVVAGRYNVTVAEFMMRNVRLDYYALQSVIKRARTDSQMQDELKAYISRGAINSDQFELLIDAVTTDSGSADLQMLGILIDYVKRYGISQEHLARIKEQYPTPCAELVEEATTWYTQMKAVKSFKNTAEGKSAWRRFCKETPVILPEVQKLMSFDQYCIFHNCGRVLDVEAIKAILNRRDQAMWKEMFAREWEHHLFDDEVMTLINDNWEWKTALDSTLYFMLPKLSQTIDKGRELSEKAQLLLLRLPESDEEILKYFQTHSLCEEAELQLLEKPRAAEFIRAYALRYKLSDAALDKMFKVTNADEIVGAYIENRSLGSKDVKLFDLPKAKALVTSYRKRFKLSTQAKKLAQQKGWI